MQATAKISGFSGTLRGTALQPQRAVGSRTAGAMQPVQLAAVQTRSLKVAPKPAPPPPKRAPASTVGGTKKMRVSPSTGTGTKMVGGTRGKVSSIEVFSKEGIFRARKDGGRPAPKVLARIEQLRLLSKLEQSGLLSQLERSGVTLSKLEKSGLLSTAEKLGVLGLLGDRSFPSTLYALAAALLVAGPAAVYLLPDDSTGLVGVQAVVALLCVLGGSAAWGGAALLSTLQKS